jgi:hypothetical protein
MQPAQIDLLESGKTLDISGIFLDVCADRITAYSCVDLWHGGRSLGRTWIGATGLARRVHMEAWSLSSWPHAPSCQRLARFVLVNDSKRNRQASRAQTKTPKSLQGSPECEYCASEVRWPEQLACVRDCRGCGTAVADAMHALMLHACKPSDEHRFFVTRPRPHSKCGEHHSVWEFGVHGQRWPSCGQWSSFGV